MKLQRTRKPLALVCCCLHSSTLGKVQNRGKNRLFVVQGGSINKGKSKGIKHLKSPFDFYEEFYSKIIDEYSTIRKPIRGNKLWNVVNK